MSIATESAVAPRPTGLASPVQYAKGVGPHRATLLRRLGVETLEDLFAFYPRRYEDRAHVHKISEMVLGNQETVQGEVLAVSLKRFRRGMSLVQIAVGDLTGIVYGAWFNQPYMKDRFKVGDRLYLFGRLQWDRRKKPVVYNPEYEFLAAGEENVHMGRIVPIYPLTEGLQQRAIRSILWQFLEQALSQVKGDLPGMSKQEALRQIHFPASFAEQERARESLAYEELFYFQLALTVKKNAVKSMPRGFAHQTRGAKALAFLRSLPFRLTRAQERVINQIRHDMGSPFPMNRLIQGDVGCGKTVVAVAAAMISLDSGYQTAFMVPTEILADQHYRNLRRLFSLLPGGEGSNGGVRLGLLTGSLEPDGKRRLLEAVANGTVDILVGTHALIQDAVTFARLGLVVIDEQHKFGVVQREKLRSKGPRPDVLVMTATPIPRTLALTLYGDLEESAIDELPPGRSRINTHWISPQKLPSAYDFIRKDVRAGHQAYVIYPLVEDSEKISSKAVISMAKNLSQNVFPELRVGLIYGKLPGPEKDKVMEDFAAGKIHVLVATSVVEVGIDVANATCMLVENAERFGLAQLHQMRGRIGRGKFPSTFILVSDPTTEGGYLRMKVLKETQDGFRIAEEDLKIRGPGEFFGVRQHGMPELKLASLISDGELLERARSDAAAVIRKDEHLQDQAHQAIGDTLRRRYQGILGKISVG